MTLKASGGSDQECNSEVSDISSDVMYWSRSRCLRKFERRPARAQMRPGGESRFLFQLPAPTSSISTNPQAATHISRATQIEQGRLANARSIMRLAIVVLVCLKMWVRNKIIECLV